jgi:hypothetical protein
MKKLVLFIAFVCSFAGAKAQPDTSDFDHVFYTRESMYEYVFGDLPDSLIQTGFLIDRNEFLDEKWKKYLVENGTVQDTLGVENWFELYRFLRTAALTDDLIQHDDTLEFKILDRLFARNPLDPFLKLPILALDFRVNRIADEAIRNGNLTFSDSKYSMGNNPVDGIEENHLLFTGLFLDSTDFSEIKLKFDPYFLQTNGNASISQILVIFGQDSTFLSSGDEALITNFIEGWNTINFIIQYDDSTSISSSFEFYFTGRNRSIEYTNHEHDFFDVLGGLGEVNDDDVSTSNPRLTYGVLFACNNNSGKIRKPVIFVSGFGMSAPWNMLTSYGQKDCKDLYDAYNIEGLMTDLRSKGHDIIIVRFIPAVADIIKDGALLAELIKKINEEKVLNNSSFENILIGYSAGAICIRYALDILEKQHLESNTPHHHSKLYVSFEGEHGGAYVPVSSQLTLKFMIEGGVESIQAQTIYYMANSPQAKQLLKYYWAETGAVGTSDPAGQGPHYKRIEFLDQLESTLNLGHSKQFEKYGYYGFPAFTRNISISNGSRFVNLSTAPQVSNVPYLFSPGHTIFESETSSSYWRAKFGYNYALQNNSSNFVVFEFTKWNMWGNIVLTKQYWTTDDYVLWGNSAGGFLYDKDDMQKKIFSLLDFYFAPEAFEHIHNYLPNSFTPIVATHAIRNFDLTPSHPNYNPNYPYQVIYDFQDEFLMFNTFDLSAQSNFYGYPVLGHPADHFSITPFEALYCDEWNQTHISSLDAVLTSPAYPEDDDMGTLGYVTIKTFIMDEIEPTVVYLQNQQVGWNTNGANYKAEYEASYAIFLGESVTPKTDVAPYEVWNNGNITCTAEVAITMSDGFHAKPGSEFHARIAPVGYAACTDGKSAEDGAGYVGNESDDQNFIEGEFNPEKEVGTYLVAPNPTTGEQSFQIIGPDDTPLTVRLFDLSGKQIYWGRIEPNTTLYTNLLPGVYVILIDNGTTEQIEKIVIQ